MKYKTIKHIIKRNIYEATVFPYISDLIYLKNKKKNKKKILSQKIGINNRVVSMKPFIENNCIFIHIPKTGGVSVSNALFENYSHGHYNYMDFKVMLGTTTYNNFFKFTFVRNPWDRVVSSFFYFKNGGGGGSKEKEWATRNIHQYDDFNEFVLKWMTNIDNRYSKVHFLEQSKFIYDYYNKSQIDYIGRFENIQQDFLYISQKLGINNKIIHLNKSDRIKDYRYYYNKKSIEIIRKIYRRDIENFKYEF